MECIRPEGQWFKLPSDPAMPARTQDSSERSTSLFSQWARKTGACSATSLCSLVMGTIVLTNKLMLELLFLVLLFFCQPHISLTLQVVHDPCYRSS
jgi:hypothetical protein